MLLSGIGVHTGHLGFYTDWRNYDVEKMVDALTLRKAESAKYPLLEVNLITESGEETINNFLSIAYINSFTINSHYKMI